MSNARNAVDVLELGFVEGAAKRSDLLDPQLWNTVDS